MLHSFDRAVRTQSVWVLRKKRLSHNVARDTGQLFFLLLDRGDLDFLFSRDRFLRERGVEQHVGQQAHAQFHIGLHHIDRHAEGIVAGVTRNGTAHGFELVRNLLGSPRFRSLQQHFGHQTRDAVVLWIFSEQATAKHCAHPNERQPMIFAHEQSQSV